VWKLFWEVVKEKVKHGAKAGETFVGKELS